MKFDCRLVNHMSHFFEKYILWVLCIVITDSSWLLYFLGISLDSTILVVSLEGYYTIFFNLLLYFLNPLNYKVSYCSKIFLDFFYDFFLLFHFVLVYVTLLFYILFLISLMFFQIVDSFSLKMPANLIYSSIQIRYMFILFLFLSHIVLENILPSFL